MKKLHFLLAFVAIVSVFAGCSKDATITNEDNSSYTLEGYIYDADGNTPMDSAVITGSFGTTYTDTTGYFEIDNLNHGTYTVVYSADGYGEMSTTYALSTDDDATLAVDYTKSVSLSMYKFDQDLETTFWGTLNNKTFALAGASYTITLDELFLDNVIEGTTGEDGSISLSEALPDAAFTLEISYSDSTGYTYEDSYDFDSPNEVKDNYSITGEESSSVFVLEDSNIFDDEGNEVDDFDASTALTFTFNNTLASVSDVVLYNYDDYKKVAVNASVSSNVLTITPVADLESGTDYYVNFTVKDEDGNSDYEYYEFSTEGSEVTSLSAPVLSLEDGYDVIDTTTTSTYLEFPAVENAEDYEIYATYGSQTEYQLISTISSSKDTIDYHLSMYSITNKLGVYDEVTDGEYFAGETLSIIVKAVNNTYDVESAYSEKLDINTTNFPDTAE